MTLSSQFGYLQTGCVSMMLGMEVMSASAAEQKQVQITPETEKKQHDYEMITIDEK